MHDRQQLQERVEEEMSKYLILILYVFLSGSDLDLNAQNTRKSGVQRPTSKKARPPQCDLIESPKLRGFYLGQRVDDIKSLIPNFREAYEYQRNRRSDATPQYLSTLQREISGETAIAVGLNSVDSQFAFDADSGSKLFMSSQDSDVSFEWVFLGEKLYAYRISYHEYDPGQSALAFIKQLSESTTLPATGWRKLATPVNLPGQKVKNFKDFEAELRCNGFKVYLNAGYRRQPELIVTDTNVAAEIARLEKEHIHRMKNEERERIRLEEKKRRTFKP